MVLTTLTVGALAETAWTAYLGLRLPRHYTAEHWDLAWVGLDTAQVLMLLLAAWAAWRRRAVLIVFACAAGTLLLVDAWFDVTTARYSDFEQSAISLAIEIPSAIVLFWIAYRTFSRLTRSLSIEIDFSKKLWHVPIPPGTEDVES
jgi:hypothetical protein